MKRKILNIFYMILFVLLVLSVKVEAKFDSSTAAWKCNSNDLYIEILKSDKNTAVAGPTEVNNSTWSYAYSPTADLPQKFYIHYYIEPGEATEPVTVTITKSEHVKSATSIETKVDTSSRNSIEGMVEVNLNDVNIEGKGAFIQLSIIAKHLSNPRTISINLNKSSEAKKAEQVRKENERRQNLLENSYKTNPGKTTDFETIYYYILSDNKYNHSGGLKSVTDKVTLEVWKTTLQGTNPDPTHYTTDNINKIVTLIDEQIAVLDGKQEEISDEAIDAVEELVAAEKKKLRDLTTNVTNETRPDQGTFTDVLENIGNYKPTDLDIATATKVEGITSKILTAVTDVGMVMAILILAILGIKYMLGSVEERAEYKKDLIPYLIGAGLLFGILSFVKILMVWGETITNI